SRCGRSIGRVGTTRREQPCDQEKKRGSDHVRQGVTRQADARKAPRRPPNALRTRSAGSRAEPCHPCARAEPTRGGGGKCTVRRFVSPVLDSRRRCSPGEIAA